MKTAIIVIAALVGGAVVWWKVSFPVSILRYKMTVTVETPEGLKTSSSVREITVTRGINLLPESSSTVSLAGEAICMELSQDSFIVIPMLGVINGVASADYGHVIVWDAIPFKDGALTREGGVFYSNLRGKKTILKPEQYPMFLYFENVNKSKIAVRLKDWDSFFEGHIKLIEVFIELTDAPVSWEASRCLSKVQNQYEGISVRKQNSSSGSLETGIEKDFYFIARRDLTRKHGE